MSQEKSEKVIAKVVTNEDFVEVCRRIKEHLAKDKDDESKLEKG